MQIRKHRTQPYKRRFSAKRIKHNNGIHPLATPMPLIAVDAYEMASEYFQDWIIKIESAIKGAHFFVEDKEYKYTAFLIHQATERIHLISACANALFSMFTQRQFLRSLSEDKDRA